MRSYHPMAVTRLLSSHGGRISPIDMANARAIDAGFEQANPDWFELSDYQRSAIFWRERVAQ